jgi:hypothetical protein
VCPDRTLDLVARRCRPAARAAAPPPQLPTHCSVDDRKRWIKDIQAAHAAVAPAAAALVAQSLSKQTAEFAALDNGSKVPSQMSAVKAQTSNSLDQARLHAMFIDFVAQSKTATRQKPASANVPMMDACCFDPSNGCS